MLLTFYLIFNAITIDEFHKLMNYVQPSIVYLQGERLIKDEVGSLVWESAQDLLGLLGISLPITLCYDLLKSC
ncbi:hypothetical protein HanIR_Chr10g0470641 [Helianthus annuus]|nr:hypothetical protein HanIR_Chr10g0470641 [Helianthus annuus]